MTQTLHARKRTRACRTNKNTGVCNCAAAKLDQPACPPGACRGMETPLVLERILAQRESLTRHLRPRLKPHAREQQANAAAATMYRPSCPRRCRVGCRAAVPCPPGQCFASLRTVLSEARLHEYAGIHGAKNGAGNFWELATMELVGEQPDLKRLHERDDLASALRARLQPT
jgi:hypothetical protein